MMLMDLTSEFAPILFGLNALFIVSGALVFAPSIVDAFAKAIRRTSRPHLVLHRPALAR
jgi:hypothetical protein